ncbi:MAG: bifunctional hydroxymethylpyrimidine kinase/phosphomethylpyrimidine kinase [Betaproteobacteria bacterium]
MKSVRKALTIAGSDSGAGAGIQADLKTFAALGVYGTSAITAITAQNTVGVSQILALKPELVAEQIDAVMEDIGAHAVKTGMLANAAIIEAVAAKIQQHRFKNVVVDPVMVATPVDLLIKKNAVATLRSLLVPLATVLTSNLPEPEQLIGMELRRPGQIEEAARRIIAMGAKTVVIKGGHRKGAALDLFFDGKKLRVLRAARIHSRNTHGTGCTFSAAIAAYLARGEALERAVSLAKEYITGAIRAGFVIGAGHSPVHHFYRLWSGKK